MCWTFNVSECTSPVCTIGDELTVCCCLCLLSQGKRDNPNLKDNLRFYRGEIPSVPDGKV